MAVSDLKLVMKSGVIFLEYSDVPEAKLKDVDGGLEGLSDCSTEEGATEVDELEDTHAKNAGLSTFPGLADGSWNNMPALDVNRYLSRLHGAPTLSCAHTNDIGPAAVAAHTTQAECTTVIFRNIPNDYTRDDLLQLLDRNSFFGCYDFVYLPIDLKRSCCLGYAFINLINHQQAQRFFMLFTGFRCWNVHTQKLAAVEWSRSNCQGLQAHIERYQKKALMQGRYPDACKPAIFMNGVRVPFPVARSKKA